MTVIIIITIIVIIIFIIIIIIVTILYFLLYHFGYVTFKSLDLLFYVRKRATFTKTFIRT